MTNPLVSIVIPTFNRGWTLNHAIDSVLSQDYDAIELIVVNDGSTDNTSDILNNYGDRISRVITQPNAGVSAARNSGIKAASGEFIAFLDSDDMWRKGKVSSQIAFFLKNPAADICQSQEIWIRNGKRVNPKKKHTKPSGMIFEPSLHLCLVSPSAVIIRKSLLDETGLFDESLPACEDYDLWLRISCIHPVWLTENSDVIKTGGHDDQLSAMPGLDKYRIRSLQNLILSGKLTPTQHSSALDVMRAKCHIYATGCMKRGKSDEADYYLAIPESF